MPTSDRVLHLSERVFLQNQSAFDVVPNSGGTATVANGDAVKFASFNLNNDRDSIDPRNKDGSRSQQQGVPGRRRGAWNFDADLEPSGTPGTAPDIDPILQAAFGAAPTIVAGSFAISGCADNGSGAIRVTSAAHGATGRVAVFISGVGGTTEANGAWLGEVVDATNIDLIGSEFTNTYTTGGTLSKAAAKYALGDAIKFFTGWQYFTEPAGAEAKVGVGCVVDQSEFRLGEDLLQFNASGTARNVISSKTFADIGTDEQSGLSAFPSIPASPTTAGGPVAGFDGRLALDGQWVDSIQRMTIRVSPGGEYVQDEWNARLSTGAVAKRRRIDVELVLKDSNGDALSNAKAKAELNETIPIAVRMGETAGSIIVFDLPVVQLNSPSRQDADVAKEVTISGVAYASGYNTKDEITIYFC